VIVALIKEATSAGATRAKACATLGISARTVERWQSATAASGEGESSDGRHGPNTVPRNKITEGERKRILQEINSPRFRDMSPNQIVPLMAGEGTYIASESTMYRIMREEKLLAHRGRAKQPERRPPNTHVATRPDQVWSWDITYLKTVVRGCFFYLYLIMDIWSRWIVGWEVYEEESATHASNLFRRTAAQMKIDPHQLVLHADNGAPMKGATMVATMEKLGVQASFSRPSVSDDNPFSESLFRTLKYHPDFPSSPFEDLAAARRWVEAFVRWYNTQHLHSAINFVTPEDRHSGADKAILARRAIVYENARTRRPDRWSGETRNWNQVAEVRLSPKKEKAGIFPAEEAVA
jgi:transposase InsO family protein